MNKLIRWYNQNRKKFWSIIGIIVLIIAILQVINYYVKKRNENQLNDYSNQTQNTVNYNYNNIHVDDNRSSITGDILSESQETNMDIIDNFINYCNNNDIENAYNLLTDECKEEMYPSIEDFRDSYYTPVFQNQKKTVSVNNWVYNTYKVEFNDDFLSTGRYEKENTKEDYITVVNVNGQNKLNINGYIERKKIEKTNEQDNIKMEVVRSDIYMDYQYYTIKVTNNTENTIVLDDGVDMKAMYIEDENGSKSSAYTHEINEGQLLVRPRETKELEIRYYSRYSSERTIERVVFSRVILNNETYTTYQNKSLYREYGQLEVEI